LTFSPEACILLPIEDVIAMLDEKYLVEKSKSLVWARFQNYSAGELKILDTYLSRINPRNPDSSLVKFTKKEYAELMGLDADLRTEQLKGYTSGLLSNVVTIDTPDKGYVQYPLFSEAKCFLDEETGQVTIEVDCNHKLKSTFFDIAKSGYVRYQLKNIISLKSQYSMRLYPKLKDKQKYGWTVSVEDLRKELDATAASYDSFKAFNRAVLQKAINEINEITDINVTAENIRKGRFVTAIRFTIEEKEQVLLDKEQAEVLNQDAIDVEDFDQITLTGMPETESVDQDDPDDPLALSAAALPKEFTRAQVELLRSLALDHMPFEITSMAERELWLFDYLRAKTMLMKASTNVQSPFAWLRQAVAEDWT
jgi:hypothetical protein